MSENKGKNKGKEWLISIDDMLRFAKKVLSYTNGQTFESFVSNEILFDATIRNLELIGEAATKVPEDIRLSNPDVSWRRIIATRNRLIHGYLGIDNHIVWSIIGNDVPFLVVKLDELKNKYLHSFDPG